MLYVFEDEINILLLLVIDDFEQTNQVWVSNRAKNLYWWDKIYERKGKLKQAVINLFLNRRMNCQIKKY